jgi:hypothetical protein
MIIKMNYVNLLATELVSDYISKGYVLSSTMSGHQGEIYKVDLYKNNEVVRIRVDEGYSRNENENHSFFDRISVVYIIVERFNELKGTLWNGEGEELNYIEFYEVDRHKGVYCDSYSEYTMIKKKQDDRLKNERCYVNKKLILKIDKCSDKLLEIVHNQKGYKSVKRNQVKYVESYVNLYRNYKYYRVMIDGKNDLIYKL